MNAATSVDEVVGALDADGYAILEGMLSAAEAASARAELSRLLSNIPEGRNPFEGFNTRRIYALFAKTRCLDGPATHPVVLGVLDRVLGPFQLSAPTGIEIGPGEVAQSLHHDDGVYPLTRPHSEVVANVMWALDDFTEANGATRVVPGSHRWVAERPDQSTPTTIAEMPAGTAAVRTRPTGRASGSRSSTSLRGCARRRRTCWRSRARWCASFRSACRNCSGTTSTRRSWATSTAATRAASSRSTRPSDPPAPARHLT